MIRFIDLIHIILRSTYLQGRRRRRCCRPRLTVCRQNAIGKERKLLL